MKKVALSTVAAGLIAAGLYFFGILVPTEPPKLRLQAVLSESGEDVTDRVDWYVEWNGAWMGPDFATITEAAPGDYTATFQRHGGEEVVATLSLAEGEGGTLLATLDATLVEVALPSDTRPKQVSFRFASPQTVGSHGVFVSNNGFAHILVSRDLSKLQLELEGQAIAINTDFSSGAVQSLILENGNIRQSE